VADIRKVIKLYPADIMQLVRAAGLVADEAKVEEIFLGKKHATFKADMQYATPLNKEYDYLMVAIKSPLPLPDSIELDMNAAEDEDRMII
jgi:hypothetical protein